MYPSPLRVLLVDDNRGDYRITLELLSRTRLEFELTWIADPDEGLAAIRSGEFHLGLLDYRLGSINGLELLAEARENGAAMPIILLTGQGDPDTDRQAIRAGAADYLVKGQLDEVHLERSIRHALERHRSEGALKASEARFRSLIAAASDAVVVADHAGRIVSWNKGAARLFGMRSEEAVGQTLSILMPERFREAHQRGLERFQQDGVPRVIGRPVELTGLRRDGNEFPLELSIATWQSPEGDYYSAILRDITERKLAEAVRQRREEQLRRHSEAYVSLVRQPHAAESDPSAAIKAITKAAALTLEVARASVWMFEEADRFLRCVDLFSLADAGHTHGAVMEATALPAYFHALETERVIAAQDACHDPRTCEFADTYLRPLGIGAMLDAPVLLRGQVVGVLCLEHTGGVREWTPEEQSFASSLADLVALAMESRERHEALEALRRSEERLQQSQKLEAVGRLAGGIAHDFNNMLAVIAGYTDLLIDECPPDSPIQRRLRQISRASDRAAAMTRQLLAFGRKQILEPRVLDLNRIVVEFQRMVERLIGEDIDISLRLAPDLWSVRVDPSQLEQVILNLCVNARDAMPKGGMLLLETRNVELDEEYARQHSGVQSGEYVLLAVSDNGCGMDSETLAHIFEPFFTTKPVGAGTGLGLATVYGIVQQSGGHLWVYSELGKGTTFKVYLPRVQAAPGVQEAVAAPATVGGSETILLVEDEPLVRSLASHLLERIGYRVLQAGDGAEAIRIAAEFASPIDLLVTDVVLPRRNGREVAEELGRSRPAMKVLYISGYTDDAILRNGVLTDARAFLEKPFTNARLAAKVRQLLDGS